MFQDYKQKRSGTMTEYTIYKVTNDLNDKIYIGSTKGRKGRDTLKARFTGHKSDARNGRTSSLPSFMRQTGAGHFSIHEIRKVTVDNDREA